MDLIRGFFVNRTIWSYDDFLKQHECDFFIEYFNKHYATFFHGGPEFPDPDALNYDTRIMTLTLNSEARKRDWNSSLIRKLHPRINLIRWSCFRHLYKAHSLKLLYDQIHHWPPGSAMGFHYDRPDTPWAFICYLNDDFKGGETMLASGEMIKPKKGTLVLMNSGEICHGVNRVIGNRFTYTGWLSPEE